MQHDPEQPEQDEELEVAGGGNAGRGRRGDGIAIGTEDELIIGE